MCHGNVLLKILEENAKSIGDITIQKFYLLKDNGYNIEFYVKESEIDENLIDRIYYSLLFN
jgi:hypothetical protein